MDHVFGTPLKTSAPGRRLRRKTPGTRRRPLAPRGPTRCISARSSSGPRCCRSSTWSAVSASTPAWPGCCRALAAHLARHLKGRREKVGLTGDMCDQLAYVPLGAVGGPGPVLEFTKHLIALRAAHPVFRRPKFFQGQEIRGSGVKDITWFTPDGAQMDDTKIWEPDIRTLGMFLNGEAIFFSGLWQRIVDDSFLFLLHAGSRPTAFILPGAPFATQYELIIDTGHTQARAGDAPSRVMNAGNAIQIEARTMLALRARWPDQ